jgi:septal ring factor EnvC (AmiA/AmiB activator)
MRIKIFTVMLKQIFLVFIFSALVFTSFAQQNKEELQRKQQQLMREIGDLNNTLKEIRKSKKQSLAELEIFKRKIRAREELIHGINREVKGLDNNIYLSTLEINKLRKELDTLKHEYAQSLVFAYKNRSNYDYLNFIFSAQSFNDAIKRITYLKSYRQYREKQVENINKTQQLIEQKIASLNNSKTEKSVALQNQGKELQVLEGDKKEQDNVVAKLKSKEGDIAQEIKKREKVRQQMRNALAIIIRREQKEAMERARIAKQKEDERIRREREAENATRPANPKVTPKTEERRTETAKPKTNRTYSPFESTEEGKSESISFESGKGRLPWPVDAGYVSIHQGTYALPGTQLKGVSDGITISLPVGSTVKAVADGEVSQVFDLGGEQAVLVRHGKYFTTYSHLSSVNVSRGQKVRAGTPVGRSAANDEGEGEVQFMVSNESGAFLNPESWLRRR